MTTLHDGARQTMAWLHGWAGLLLGHLLYLIAFAGTLSVFRAEIGRWTRPETLARTDAASAADAAGRWLGTHAKDATNWYLALPDGRGNVVESYASTARDFMFRALDPVTGAPVPRQTLGGEFFYRLHFELELPFPWGRLLASLAAAVMLIALVTGVIAHRRLFRDFFTFRAAKGQRSWLDAHNVLGVLSLPFHIMITLTGILALMSLSFPWPALVTYPDPTKLYADLAPGTVARAAAGKPAPLAPLGALVRDASRRCGGGVLRVSVSNPGDAAAVVTATCADRAGIATNRGQISYDGVTGRLLGGWIERRPVVGVYNVLYGLHIAHFAPALLRWLYFLGGAMLTLAIATGLILWTVKRGAKRPTASNRLLERVNAGVILGAPIGAAAFLIANRMLPLDLAGRPAAEVSAALWSAAAALLMALVLPDRLRWSILYASAAAALLAAPVVGGGARWLGAAWRTGDMALIGGDVMLVALASVCAALAARASRA